MEVHGACAMLVISSQPFNPVFLPATLASARLKCRRAGFSLSAAAVPAPDSYSYCVPSLLVHVPYYFATGR